jgi:succinate dehydrogenase / fumarate reductase flavoprotein subunit
MWDDCGMSRTKASLEKALAEIPSIRERFWREVGVPGTGEELNAALEEAGRVADFLEFAELVCYDALERNESCGAHFREEYQSEDGEPRRNDAEYAYVAGWEYKGPERRPEPHKEPLVFEEVKPSIRSYR